MKTNLLVGLCLLLNLSLYSNLGHSQSVNSYCAFDSYGDKYELSLENGTGRLTYNKYDRSGRRIQSLNGTWELRDEGLYGPAEKVTAFVNSGVLKFLVIRTSRGDVQELRAESGGKVWSPCGGSSYSGSSGSSKPIEYNPNAKAIIGEAITIGTLMIAQYDMPEVLDWWDGVDECKRLGDGWRLPSLSELNIMYQNKSLLGNMTRAHV